MTVDAGLAGRVILITGASSAAGRSAARRLVAEGARVAAGTRRPERLGGLAEEARVAGGEALALAVDVTDEESVRTAVAATVARFGRLDGAFNAAGAAGAGRPSHATDSDRWRTVLDVSLTGTFLAMKHEIGALLESGGGAIVNTTSLGGLVAQPGFTDSAAAAGAVHGLTRTAALEYAERGIRVNAVVPGGDDGAAVADDVADVALFLLSPRSSATTGAVVPADGGRHALSRTSSTRRVDGGWERGVA